MRASGLLTFFTIALFVYALTNLYIFNRGWQASSWMGPYRPWVLLAFVILALAYPMSRLAERFFRNEITETAALIGSFYLAALFYFFLMILLLDFVRLANHFLHFLPSAIRQNPAVAIKWCFLLVLAVVVMVVGAGHMNAMRPRIRVVELGIRKPASHLKGLRIVVASDIHLGRNIRNSHLARIVEMMNGLEPDLVLLPGDLLDEDIDGPAEREITATLRQIRARHGVFAVTGNHEYYLGVARSVARMRQANVTPLEDAAVKVADAFYLLGRKDLTALRFGEDRKALGEILEGVDRRYPIILMDHQPIRLEEARDHGIELQVSGHTHHGQLFPFHWITQRVYEVSWGYLRKGDTQYYVSCGLGTWGPPVRIGSVPEIVLFKVTFGKD